MNKGKPSSPTQLLFPKNDFVFKLLFGSDTPQSKELLLHFLNDVFNIPESYSLAAVQLLNPHFDKRHLQDKQIALDIHARIPGEGYINIEMQLANQYNIDKRSLYYSSQIISGQVQKSEKYKLLRKTTTINLLYFNYFPHPHYHNIYHLTEKRTGIPYTNLLQLHFIEMKKFENLQQSGTTIEEQDRLAKWIRFLTNEDDSMWEHLAQEHPIINKAVNYLKEISENSMNRWYYEMRQKAIMDMDSMMEGAREEGEAKGRTEGKTEGKVEVAIRMLRKGVDLDIIMEFTGFSKAEILEIQNNLFKD